MSSHIIRQGEGRFFGCDFVVQLGEARKNTPIKLLQITDTQIIDSTQRRTPDRLRPDEISAWLPENFDAQCGNHIRSLVAQTRPDLIFITGDLVYGSFDDNGTALEYYCKLMDSFAIPWAPVWGNHDNESARGIVWQCEQLQKSKYCLFKRGNVSGNGNYTVGIATGDRLVRVLHLLDSNGCRRGNEGEVIKQRGLYPDQLKLVENNTKLISLSQGRSVPAFMAFHYPVDCFETAEIANGYKTESRPLYVLGVDVEAKDGDFGFSLEEYDQISTDGGFIDFIKAQNVDGVFVGHVHKNTTSINYENVRWTFGMKTGQYDYHVAGSVGGTLVVLVDNNFSVSHVPSLVPYAPIPGKAKMFDDFFTKEE